jgi:hypothetical protein
MAQSEASDPAVSELHPSGTTISRRKTIRKGTFCLLQEILLSLRRLALIIYTFSLLTLKHLPEATHSPQTHP